MRALDPRNRGFASCPLRIRRFGLLLTLTSLGLVAVEAGVLVVGS